MSSQPNTLLSATGCWSINIQNESDGRLKLEGCSCPHHEKIVVVDEDIPKMVINNYKKGGVVILERDGAEITIDAARRAILYMEEDGSPYYARDACGDIGNVSNGVRICVCYSCQTMKKHRCQKRDWNLDRVLSSMTGDNDELLKAIKQELSEDEVNDDNNGNDDDDKNDDDNKDDDDGKNDDGDGNNDDGKNDNGNGNDDDGKNDNGDGDDDGNDNSNADGNDKNDDNNPEDGNGGNNDDVDQHIIHLTPPASPDVPRPPTPMHIDIPVPVI